MSASEKLRALDGRMKNIRTRRIVTTAEGHGLFFEVSDALPQIVAVVEKAEQYLDTGRGDLDGALAALDEALS